MRSKLGETRPVVLLGPRREITSSVERWFADVQLSSINDSRLINLGPGVLNKDTAVFATVAEIGGGEVPFLGSAMISVWNVVPRDDGKVLIVVRVVPELLNLRVRVQ